MTKKTSSRIFDIFIAKALFLVCFLLSFFYWGADVSFLQFQSGQFTRNIQFLSWHLQIFFFFTKMNLTFMISVINSSLRISLRTCPRVLLKIWSLALSRDHSTTSGSLRLHIHNHLVSKSSADKQSLGRYDT